MWLKSITGNKDNPRGARRVVPFSDDNQPDKVYTEMYSMPNGEQALEQDHEGKDSAEESGDWESQDDDDEDESDESDDEEVADSPPCSEHRSKQHHDPTGGRAPRDIVVLPDDDEEEMPPKERRRRGKGSSRRGLEVQVPQSTPVFEAVVERSGDPVKVIHEASQVAYNASTALQTNVKRSCDLGAQLSELNKNQISLQLDLELAKKNLKTAQEQTALMGDVRSENYQLRARLKSVVSLEKMKEAPEKKDLDLAAAQKEAREKTALADKKLASVGKLEEENSKL
nr:DNA polymerase alpha catalytic subunit-like [Aegilops tauschii subsp. strangulata]